MDIEEVLIEEVRNRTILYDLGHPEYKNIKKKEYEWRAVAAAVKLNEEECKKRWKGLRDSYRRCKRMQQVASGSGSENPKKRWRYYEAMSFLDSFANSRCTVGNIPFEEMVEEDIIVLDENVEPCSSYSSTPIPHKKKKKESDKYDDFLKLATSSISETCGAFINQNQPKDATEILFMSLATKIKDAKMPPNIINGIESKVSSLVFAEIGNFLSKTQSEHN